MRSKSTEKIVKIFEDKNLTKEFHGKLQGAFQTLITIGTLISPIFYDHFFVLFSKEDSSNESKFDKLIIQFFFWNKWNYSGNVFILMSFLCAIGLFILYIGLRYTNRIEKMKIGI